MTITERGRHDMLRALETSIGKDAAMTLADHLPPVGWADVATKADIESLATATKADIEMLATATKADIEMLATACEARFEAIDHRFDTIDRHIGELEQHIDLKLRTGMAELQIVLANRFSAQTRVLYISVISTVITLLGLVALGR